MAVIVHNARGLHLAADIAPRKHLSKFFDDDFSLGCYLDEDSETDENENDRDTFLADEPEVVWHLRPNITRRYGRLRCNHPNRLNRHSHGGNDTRRYRCNDLTAKLLGGHHCRSQYDTDFILAQSHPIEVILSNGRRVRIN